MKRNLMLTLAFSVTFTCSCFAQRSQLKGPAAKNYKPWKDSKAGTTLVIIEQKLFKDPKTKNQKPWEGKNEKYSLVYVERNDLKGPNAQIKIFS